MERREQPQDPILIHHPFYQCYTCGVYTRDEPGDSMGLDERDGEVIELFICQHCADEEYAAQRMGISIDWEGYEDYG